MAVECESEVLLLFAFSVSVALRRGIVTSARASCFVSSPAALQHCSHTSHGALPVLSLTPPRLNAPPFSLCQPTHFIYRFADLLDRRHSSPALSLQRRFDTMSIRSDLLLDDWVVDQAIKESLTCAICYDLLYQPVNLSTCSHTFCLHCLRACVRQSRSKCPLCATPFSSNIHAVLSTTDCISGFCNEQLRKVKVSCPHCRSGRAYWVSTATLSLNTAACAAATRCAALLVAVSPSHATS